MSAPIFNFAVEGVVRVRTALKLASTDAGARVRKEIARATKAVEAGAIARVPVRTSELKDTIRSDLSRDGLTGLVKAGFGQLKRRSRSTGKRRRKSRVQMGPIEPGIYAMVVEFGDKNRNKPAEPYFFPAFDAEKPALVEGIRSAINETVHFAEASAE